ncbi:MAG TPA: hypothetical protein VKV22_11775 [Rhodanobacteraceae bacterium]|nr:hypothetical protein [Rhodanobacteraceae bacterium]
MDDETPLSPQDEAPNSLTAETLRRSGRGEDVFCASDARDFFERLGLRAEINQDVV